jgi:hypothetical protein
MTYGFEAYRADGTTMISSTDGVARVIYSQDYAESFSGTINVPAFDSNLGYYTVRLYPYKHTIQAGVGYAPVSESTSWSAKGGYRVCISQSMKPTLSWNNSSKNLTITANSETEDFYIQTIRYRYRLFMVHYR